MAVDPASGEDTADTLALQISDGTLWFRFMLADATCSYSNGIKSRRPVGLDWNCDITGPLVRENVQAGVFFALQNPGGVFVAFDLGIGDPILSNVLFAVVEQNSTVMDVTGSAVIGYTLRLRCAGPLTVDGYGMGDRSSINATVPGDS